MSFEEQIYAILSNCEKDQLNKYLNEDDSLDTLIESLSQFKNFEIEKENMEKVNKQQAQSNLSKEPLLQDLRERLTNAIKEFEDTKKEFSSLKETYDAQNTANGDMSLESVFNMLQSNAVKTEEDTDKLADEFFCENSSLHTEEELNTFQKQFLEMRTQAHILKIKADKMKELLPNY